MNSWKKSRFGCKEPDGVHGEASPLPRDQTLHVPLYHTPGFTPNDVQASQFNFFLVEMSPEMESALLSAVAKDLGTGHVVELPVPDGADTTPCSDFEIDEGSSNSLSELDNASTAWSDAQGICWDDQDASMFVESDTRDDQRLEDLLNTNNAAFRTSSSRHEVFLRELVRAATNVKASSKRLHDAGPTDPPREFRTVVERVRTL